MLLLLVVTAPIVTGKEINYVPDATTFLEFEIPNMSPYKFYEYESGDDSEYKSNKGSDNKNENSVY